MAYQVLSKSNVKHLSKEDKKKHFERLEKESEDAEKSKWVPKVPQLFEVPFKNFIARIGRFKNEKVVIHLLNVDPIQFEGKPERFIKMLERHFEMMFRPQINFDQGMMSEDKKSSSPDSFSLVWFPDVPDEFVPRIRRKVNELDALLAKNRR